MPTLTYIKEMGYLTILLKTFQYYDKNNDGKLDKEEWLTKMKEIPEIDEGDLENMWEKFDVDSSGEIDQFEFIEMLGELLERYEESVLLQILWAIADGDNNGHLTNDEMLPFVKIFAQMGDADPDSDEVKSFSKSLEKILKEEAGDGNIDYEVFKKVMKEILDHDSFNTE